MEGGQGCLLGLPPTAKPHQPTLTVRPNTPTEPVASSLRLDLHGSAVLLNSSGNDDKVAASHVLLSLYDLSDRANGVDNGSARLVRRECLQRLQRAVAIRIAGERKHIGLLGLEPG